MRLFTKRWMHWWKHHLSRSKTGHGNSLQSTRLRIHSRSSFLWRVNLKMTGDGSWFWVVVQVTSTKDSEAKISSCGVRSNLTLNSCRIRSTKRKIIDCASTLTCSCKPKPSNQAWTRPNSTNSAKNSPTSSLPQTPPKPSKPQQSAFSKASSKCTPPRTKRSVRLWCRRRAPSWGMRCLRGWGWWCWRGSWRLIGRSCRWMSRIKSNSRDRQWLHVLFLRDYYLLKSMWISWTNCFWGDIQGKYS